MKKIVLALAFCLISTPVFATYYGTTTTNCGDAAMLAELDRATATHRAVITEIKCNAPAPIVREIPRPVVRPVVYVEKPVVVAQPIVVRRPVIVEYVPVTVVSVEEDVCTCDACGC
ncbi:MAG: hypothetical protein II843_02425 [Alphaproteobacteria bacterium]|nr:hypothetical protein [Alphaproteobacteria bacterium]MBQ9540647.1 hypothetical protein [Alphaproteobacteria bacterium]